MKNLKESKKNFNKKDSNYTNLINKNQMNFNVINIEESNNNKQNEMNKKDIKLKKKHTWVYDQLFVKNNIVDESFELENEEEEITSIKRQLLFNKYNILSEEIYQLKKEKNKWIEQLLRLMAELTKDILELKKKIKNIQKEK